MSMTGGDALVATLIEHKIETAFGVSGESFLSILEAFRQSKDRIRFVPTRHEAGAAFAADGYARFARRPGALFVTRGPGASNAAIGMHVAAQDSVPVILFIGHVPTPSKGIEGFQEIDYHQMYGKIAKGVIEPEIPAQVAEATARAIRLSLVGRPGPVVVVLPRDVTEGDAGEPPMPPDYGRAPVGADADGIARAARALREARNPVILVGELVHWEQASNDVVALAETSGASVMAAYRWQSAFPNGHRAYMGHIELDSPPYQKTRWPEFDVIVAVGTRLDQATIGRHARIHAHQRLTHIYPDGNVLARFNAEVALMSDVSPAVRALSAALRGFTPPPERKAWQAGMRALQEQFVTPGAAEIHGDVDMAEVAATVGRIAPENSVMVCDSGTFARWVHRYYPWRRPKTYGGPAAGAMGYAVPGAIGIKLARPATPVIAFVGDGGFQMTGQEMMTAAEHGIPIKVIVCDNRAWGSMMQSQTEVYGAERRFATALAAPDFCALAQAYGAAAFRVDRTAEFADALVAALSSDGPALVHLITDSRDITPFGPWDP